MPRSLVPADCFHGLNRGNERARLFFEDSDYAQVIALMHEATRRHPIQLFAYCVMPNHFHVVGRGDFWHRIAKWFHWLLTTHATRHRLKYGGTGHVWQGRYRTFPVQNDDHLLTVMRYVERNPVAASMVPRARDWPWSSAGERKRRSQRRLVGLVDLPERWEEWVDTPLSERETAVLRQSIVKGTPYGSEDWVHQTVRALGIEHTIRTRGRPRKRPEK